MGSPVRGRRAPAKRSGMAIGAWNRAPVVGRRPADCATMVRPRSGRARGTATWGGLAGRGGSGGLSTHSGNITLGLVGLGGFLPCGQIDTAVLADAVAD